jgi:radical SAM superfamily enzyme YgiQ (UPF0313 family)
MPKVNILLLAVYNDDMLIHFEEIGIAFIASFLRQHGYEVKLIGVHENSVDYDKIVNYSPDIIGMSVYENSKQSVYHVIEKVKQLIPGVLVCVGGSLPTHNSKEILEECPLIDFLVRGEGELTFLELASHLSNIEDNKLEDIKGLIYRRDNLIKENEKRPMMEDIDILPMPARDMLRDNNLKLALLSTSRGCKSKCTFCISSLFWKRWRGRSIEKIIDELEYIINQYGIKTFNIIDGSFEDPGPGFERAWNIAEAIVKRNLNISYYTNLRAEFHRRATHELMMLLKESGLCCACVGIESANQFDLRLYGKLSTPEDNAKIIELLRRYDINVDPGFINFNPYSTFEGLRKNIDFLETYGLACNFWHIDSKFRMFKGTRLYSKVKNDSLLEEGKFAEKAYRFLNPGIACLSDYITDLMKKIDKQSNDGAYIISYFTIKYPTVLVHLKRQLKIAGEKDAYETVLKAEQQSNFIITDMNKAAAKWFKELLALAEKGWDRNKADEISNLYLNPDYIKENAKALNRFKSKLYKELVKSDLDSYLFRIMGA